MNSEPPDGRAPVACLPEDARVLTPEEYIGGIINGGAHRIDSINAIGSKFVVFNLRNMKTGEVDTVAKILKEEFDPRAPLLKALPEAMAEVSKNPDRAIRICERLLKLDSVMEAAAFNKGVARLAKGETVLALEAFDLAVSIAPEDIWNLVHRAACFATLNRDSECLRDVLAAAEINGAQLCKCLLELPKHAASIHGGLKREARGGSASHLAAEALRSWFGLNFS